MGTSTPSDDTAAAGTKAPGGLPPTDEQLWWSVRETVRSVLLPQLADPWSRLAAVQLVGLVDFARGRGEDPWPARFEELRSALGLPAATDPGAVMQAATDALLAGGERRAGVRPILLRQLDEDMGRTAPLVPAFRGLLPENDPPPHTPSFHQPVELADGDPAALGPAATILAAWLEQRLGRPVGIAAIDRLAEGHSRAMFTVALEGGTRYVLRMEQGGVFGTSSAEEFRVMRALYDAGIPVARVRWQETDPGVLGQPFFVMDFVEADRGANPSADTGRDFIETLHRLHELDWQTAGAEFDIVPPSPDRATPLQVERWRQVYRSSTPLVVPLLEEAAAYLLAHAPPLDRVHVVHGDAGPGNFVHKDGRIVAITDFEFCHLGDPAEDWAFCATMRGHRTMSREDWIDAYQEVLGFEMGADRWAYWEAFNLFKGTCANLTALRVFADGTNPAPNMLQVGTALHQIFLRRLVDLIEQSARSTMSTAVSLNPFTTEAIEDPYAVYAALRERGVTYLPEGDLFLVSRYDDVKQLLLDHHVYSSKNVGGERGAADPDLVVASEGGFRSVAVLTPADPPAHTWYRRLVTRQFAPDGVRRLQDSIERIVEELIDGFVADGSCDLVAAFCQPFPLYVFAELMGIDTADIPQIKRWTDDRLEMIGAATGIVPKPRMIELLRSNVAMQHYLYGLVEEVRRVPRDDLLTHLVFGTLPGLGDRPLDDDELMSMIQTLLDGGNDTTINLVANGMGLLLEHPEQLQVLRDDPAVVGNAVEEVLRYEAPVQCLFRNAREDTELGGVAIPANGRLAVLYGAANRDARRWPDADTFDVRRPDAKDALHFGAGIHFCLGAHLARLEGRLAFEALVRRLPGLRLVPGANDFHHHPSPIVRGLHELHVAWDV